MNHVAFDLEIATPLPENSNGWVSSVGISCAATYKSGDEEPRLWHGAVLGAFPYPERMSQEECEEMVNYLTDCQNDGYPVVTWNGAGFDMRVLAEECGHDIGLLTLEHIDMAFHMLCVKGYMIGLNTAAHGLEVGSKMEGMHGSLAPVMWAEGRESQEKVLQYVAQDAILTSQVYQAIQEKKRLPWTSRSGNPQVWFLNDRGLLPVCEADQLPLPDTSWMTNPRMRGDCLGWLLKTE
jgi:hypothetical protein